jgi:hypothetical protein
MSWVFTGLLKRARERERYRRLNLLYAQWIKRHRESKSRNPEQERRLLGTSDRA